MSYFIRHVSTYDKYVTPFIFYHNIFFFLTTCMSFSITNIFWYIYYFFVTAWQERELKMSNLPLSPWLEREHFLLSCWVC